MYDRPMFVLPLNGSNNNQQEIFQIPQYIAAPQSTFGQGGSSNINWSQFPLAQNYQNQYQSMMSNPLTSPTSVATQPQGLISKAWNGFEGLLSGKSGQALGTTFGIGSQLFGAWGGMKQLDLANKQFNLQKDLMNKNYNAQRSLTNTRLRDRQNARNAADKDFYQDTAEYMKENEVK